MALIRNGNELLGLKCYELCEKQLSKEAVAAATKQVPTPISTAVKVPLNQAVNYVTLASFSWEQDSDKVKVRSCYSQSNIASFFSMHCINIAVRLYI